MLAEGHFTINQWFLDNGEFDCSQILLSEQPVHRPGAGGRQKHALGVDPAISLVARR